MMLGNLGLISYYEEDQLTIFHKSSSILHCIKLITIDWGLRIWIGGVSSKECVFIIIYLQYDSLKSRWPWLTQVPDLYHKNSDIRKHAVLSVGKHSAEINGEETQPFNSVYIQCTSDSLHVQHHKLTYFSSQNNRVNLRLQSNTLVLYVLNKLQTLDTICVSK